MSTNIPALQQDTVRNAILMDITVDTVTYNICTSFSPITVGNVTYASMGAFLSVTAMGEDLKANDGDISISLSGIPYAVIYSVLEATIKGGEVVIWRVFFDEDYRATTRYQRFKGVITNYTITEDIDIIKGKLTNTVTITAASINKVLDNRINGQRTSASDREKFYPGDTSFDRIIDLHNTSFDFGRPMGATGGVGSTTGNGLSDWELVLEEMR